MPLTIASKPSAPPAHACTTVEGQGLAAILGDPVNLAIWQRDDAPVVDVGDLDAVADVAVIVPAGARSAIPDALIAAGYDDALATRLGHDIGDLTARFAALLALDRVAIRLEVIETDACRRFHADYVAVRLICTYAGPGTQWLANDDALALAAGVEPTTIRSIATGDVALFKGRDQSDTPIVHRSPPIMGTGTRRLVLVIDPARPDQPAATRSASTDAKPAR
ncbi:DUF1826 domain-containing protein [Sphingomonas sp. T9W2]|uniref:DUF1826 domain-containing protein n=1 Tax=Sphingomonas sp. T9W2 TaxID=3143183 RepID=UPI0031F550FD